MVTAKASYQKDDNDDDNDNTNTQLCRFVDFF